MKVELLAHTPFPEKVIAMAAKLCYSSSTIDEIGDGLTDGKVAKFIDMLASIGHESPMEHVSFTFGIEGISRACSHQLVRHRIASYSQKSQRYVSENHYEYITPPTVAKYGYIHGIYENAMQEAQKAYDYIRMYLTEELEKEGMDRKVAEKIANEDARFVLPNACETKIVVTMNVRSLFNFFQHRCCNRAQWEIRELAEKMYDAVCGVCPNIFKHAGPSCFVTGKCPEGKMTCGKMKEMCDKYENKHKNVPLEKDTVHIPLKHLDRFKDNYDAEGNETIVYVDGENYQYARLQSDGRTITDLGLPGPAIVNVDHDECVATNALGQEFLAVFVVHLNDIPPVDYDNPYTPGCTSNS